MRKAKLYQLLAVAGGLSTAVATTPVLAGGSVALAAGGGEGEFTVEFVGQSGNTWSYRVSETGGSGQKDLSHWSFGIANCEGKVSSPSPSSGFESGKGGASDASLGADWMIKWNTGGGVGSGQVFTFTLDGDYESTDVGVLVKTGGNPQTAVGSVTGPDCSSPVVDDAADEGEDDAVSGGNPNMACSEITGSNDAPMSLIAKYETDDSGNYNFEGSGTDIINIEGNLSGGTFSVDSGVVKVAAVIVKGGTVALADEDGNDSFSNAGLVNGGGQIADISNVQFCQEGVFDSAGAEVCLWTADKDADGNYVNIEQVGCVDAEKGKFYAIEAAGEFSSTLEAE
jgi:hypothetical protein